MLWGAPAGTWKYVPGPIRGGDSSRPVLGAWGVTLPTPPGRFDALVQREVSTLSGFFEFELWGRWWVVRFDEATWDGEVVRFVEPTDFGQREADSLVYWEARYLPARSQPPATPRADRTHRVIRPGAHLLHRHDDLLPPGAGGSGGAQDRIARRALERGVQHVPRDEPVVAPRIEQIEGQPP